MNESFISLCQLCSPNSSLDEIKPEAINWKSVYKLALRHHVVPVMADRIKQLNLPIPDETTQLMAGYVQKNLFKGMSQAAELVSLTQTFQQNNLSFVVFKGIALIKLNGLGLHQRHHGDIDILLKNSEDLWRADKILNEKMGYKRLTLANLGELNSSQKKHFLNYGKDIEYINIEKGISIELHFKLLPSNTMCPFSTEKIYKRHSHFIFGDTLIPCMSKKDHQLYLLLHGSISRWFRLKWLCDIPAISNNGQCYFDSEFMDNIKRHNIERMVIQGLVISYKFLRMPTANKILNTVNNDHIVNFITNKSEEFLISTETLRENRPNQSKYFFSYYFDLLKYKFSLMKGWRYKKDVIMQYSTEVADWEVISLPNSLFPLYYFLHPFLWLKRQF